MFQPDPFINDPRTTMKKTKTFDRVIFTPTVLSQAIEAFKKSEGEIKYTHYSIKRGNEHWILDTESEIMAELRRGFDSATIHIQLEKSEININLYKWKYEPRSEISIRLERRDQIEGLFELFENATPHCLLPDDPEPPKPPKPQPIVFIGHGRCKDWRDLKDHLVDKHNFKVEAYEVGARAGHSIRDILDEMLKSSSIAFLVLSAEDEGIDGKFRARENVIHELGLFQGKIGFPRAIALMENSTNEFSNMHGVQQIRYNNGNIREVFGEVLAVIKREFNI